MVIFLFFIIALLMIFRHFGVFYFMQPRWFRSKMGLMYRVNRTLAYVMCGRGRPSGFYEKEFSNCLKIQYKRDCTIHPVKIYLGELLIASWEDFQTCIQYIELYRDFTDEVMAPYFALEKEGI